MSSFIFTFYKIISKNENIKEIYIGKTTNFKRRVVRHKSNCNNINGSHYNLKVYQYIRENGGWDNFDMIEIEKGEYDNKDSAFRERYWIEELNANLNSEIPSRTAIEYRKKNREILNQKNKEYRDKNIEYYKEYCNKNIEKIKEKQKEYYQKNIEKILQHKKKYYENNNKKIKEEITCGCGCILNKSSLSKHLKTKKHQEYLLNEIN
jgi:hypothetical protein